MSAGFHRLGSNVPGKLEGYSNANFLVQSEEAAKWFEEEKKRLEEQGHKVIGDSVLIDVQSPLDPRQMGYTGDVCKNCQSTRVIHTGHCDTCQDCGETTSCS